MFVSRINTEKLLEAYEVREMHEGLAARLCCTRVTRGEIAKLAELGEQIYAEGRAGHVERMSQLDRELHNALAHLAGNSMLIRLADNYVVLGKVVRANRDPKETYQEHLAILQAIGNGQEDEAERVMRAHIRAGRELVQQLFEKGVVPDWVT
jgi:DNA-binding GntR family transcriptional regulator